jgi:hypothetical protein
MERGLWLLQGLFSCSIQFHPVLELRLESSPLCCLLLISPKGLPWKLPNALGVSDRAAGVDEIRREDARFVGAF